jgi:hypothetical protein
LAGYDGFSVDHGFFVGRVGPVRSPEYGLDDLVSEPVDRSRGLYPDSGFGPRAKPVLSPSRASLTEYDGLSVDHGFFAGRVGPVRSPEYGLDDLVSEPVDRSRGLYPDSGFGPRAATVLSPSRAGLAVYDGLSVDHGFFCGRGVLVRSLE